MNQADVEKREFLYELECEGVSVTVSSVSYTALRGNMRRALERQQKDYINNYRLSFAFFADTVAPAVNAKITYDGVVYRVLDIDTDEHSVIHICHCGSEYA